MLSDALRGAISGAVGTTLMSELLAFGKSGGFIVGEIPHKEIVENFERKTGLDDDIPDALSEVGWITQHFLYGTVAGAVYGVIQGRIRMSHAFIPAGVVFGLSLWAIGFGGWAPVAGLYPPPAEDDKRTLGTELAAHLLYGAVAATIHWMLGKQRIGVR